MTTANIETIRPSDRLLQLLAGYDRCCVVVHDNPDPDAIAAGWGIYALVEELLGQPVQLVGGGAILRAENKHMVELLQPPIELVESLELEPGTAAVLVDCGLGNSNHLLTRAGIRPVAIVDHHQPTALGNGIRGNGPLNSGLASDRSPTNRVGHTNGHGPVNGHCREVPYCDIRAQVSASATLVASYFREQGLEPGVKLATAMLYALHTETRGSECRYSHLDRRIVLWLTRRADPSLLAEIENAPLSRSYYGDLILALQSTFVYDNVALCFLPRAHGSEIVGEVADLLIRDRTVDRVLCGGAVGSDLLLSARTDREDDNATLLLHSTVHGLGTAGGHEHRAGGKIPHAARDGRIMEAVEDALRGRWLTACGVDRQRGTRLIARREIVENL